MDIIKRILHFIASVFMYSILSIMVLIIVTVVVYVVEEKQSLEDDYYVSPLFSAYIIISPSMEPNIHVYDAVVDHKALPASINVGDIITFVSSDPISYGKTITHRVVGMTQDAQGNYRYRTKGDNNNVEDSWIVPETHVLGKVMFRVPKLGYIQQFLSTSTGWIIAIVIPSLCIIVYDIIKIIIALLASKNKENEEQVGESTADTTASAPPLKVPLPVEAIEEDIPTEVSPNIAIEIPSIPEPVQIEEPPEEPTLPSIPEIPKLTPLEPIVIPSDMDLPTSRVKRRVHTYPNVTPQDLLNASIVFPKKLKKRFPYDYHTIELIKPLSRSKKEPLYESLLQYPFIELITPRPIEVSEDKVVEPIKAFPDDFEVIEVIKPSVKKDNTSSKSKGKKKFPKEYKNIITVKPKKTKKERND